MNNRLLPYALLTALTLTSCNSNAPSKERFTELTKEYAATHPEQFELCGRMMAPMSKPEIYLDREKADEDPSMMADERKLEELGYATIEEVMYHLPFPASGTVPAYKIAATDKYREDFGEPAGNAAFVCYGTREPVEIIIDNGSSLH